MRESFTLDGLVRGELPGLFLITPSIRLLKAAGKRATVFGELPVTPSTKDYRGRFMNFVLTTVTGMSPLLPFIFG
ncbi:MAG: hypothetical protein IPG53_03545 [Ignavibacteriales bacterium]|nr:hypothetical protein [Ignavibacteriales bacterium]